MPKGKRRYCSNSCARTAQSRRYRARKQGATAIDSKPKPVNEVGRTETTADGRVSARRPPEHFVEDGWFDLLAEGEVTQAQAARSLETTDANVSRWFEWCKRERMIEAEAAGWQMSEEAKRALGDFRFFRARYFKIARGPAAVKGKPPVTTEFHMRWIESILDALPAESGGTGEADVGKRLMILSPPRHGKLAADSTPVLTPLGWRLHGDLKPGDEVFAPDGAPTRIAAVSPKGVADTVVRFSDGAEVKVHPNHEWRVYDRHLKRYRTLETRQLTDEGLHYGELRNGDPRCRWLADYTSPVSLEDAWLPVDPYLLGVWLGDGQAEGASICGAPDDLAEILVEVKARGWEPSWESIHSTTGVRYVGFRGLKEQLRDAGVLCNKHIPDGYFAGSEQQRRDLLRGLVDSDGHVCHNTGRVRVVGANRRLIEQVGWLANTLGYRTTITEQQPQLSSSGIQGKQIVYTAQWTPHDGTQQAYLARKDHRGEGLRRRRSIVAIEQADPEPGHCIQVEHPSQCYLVGRELVPTHNSLLLSHFVIWLILRNPDIVILWVAKSEPVARRFGSMIRDELERNELLIAEMLGPGGAFKPENRTGAQWRDDEFEVATRTTPQPAPTFKAIGRGANVQSMDVDFLVCDDIENYDSTRTPESRQTSLDWFLTEPASRKEEQTAWVLIGSRNHAEDIPHHILHSSEWETVVETAHDPHCERPIDELDAHDDCVLWPGVRTYRYLTGQREDIGEARFALRYLNDPRAHSETIFSETAMRACLDSSRNLGDVGLIPAGYELLGSIDPSPGVHQIAELWAWSRENPVRYLVDIVKTKGGIDAWEDLAASWLDIYGLGRWVVEANSAQSDYVNRREFMQWCHDYAVIVDPHKTGANKHSLGLGVRSMHPLYVKGQIVLPYGDSETRGKVDAFIREHVNYDPDRTQRDTKWRIDRVMTAWFASVRIDTLQGGRVQAEAEDNLPDWMTPDGLDWIEDDVTEGWL